MANSDVKPDDEVGVGATEDNCTPDLFVAENANVSQAEAVDGTVCVEILAESNNSKPHFHGLLSNEVGLQLLDSEPSELRLRRRQCKMMPTHTALKSAKPSKQNVLHVKNAPHHRPILKIKHLMTTVPSVASQTHLRMAK